MAFWTPWGDNKKWKAEKAERDEAITAAKPAEQRKVAERNRPQSKIQQARAAFNVAAAKLEKEKLDIKNTQPSVPPDILERMRWHYAYMLAQSTTAKEEAQARFRTLVDAQAKEDFEKAKAQIQKEQSSLKFPWSKAKKAPSNQLSSEDAGKIANVKNTKNTWEKAQNNKKLTEGRKQAALAKLEEAYTERLASCKESFASAQVQAENTYHRFKSRTWEERGRVESVDITRPEAEAAEKEREYGVDKLKSEYYAEIEVAETTFVTAKAKATEEFKKAEDEAIKADYSLREKGGYQEAMDAIYNSSNAVFLKQKCLEGEQLEETLKEFKGQRPAVPKPAQTHSASKTFKSSQTRVERF